MIKAKVTQEIDLKVWDEIIAKTENLGNWEVEYGYYENQSHPESDLSLADIAAINEFGSKTKNIPSRPFMFQTSLSHSADKQHEILYLDMLFKRKPLRSALKEIGERGVQLVEQIIDMGNFEANAPFTIDLKGFDRPLVDTGYLKSHAKSKVQKRSD